MLSSSSQSSVRVIILMRRDTHALVECIYRWGIIVIVLMLMRKGTRALVECIYKGGTAFAKLGCGRIKAFGQIQPHFLIKIQHLQYKFDTYKNVYENNFPNSRQKEPVRTYMPFFKFLKKQTMQR